MGKVGKYSIHGSFGLDILSCHCLVASSGVRIHCTKKLPKVWQFHFRTPDGPKQKTWDSGQFHMCVGGEKDLVILFRAKKGSWGKIPRSGFSKSDLRDYSMPGILLWIVSWIYNIIFESWRLTLSKHG